MAAILPTTTKTTSSAYPGPWPQRARPLYLPGTLLLESDEFLPTKSTIRCQALGLYSGIEVTVFRVAHMNSFKGIFVLLTTIAAATGQTEEQVIRSAKRQGFDIYVASDQFTRTLRSSGRFRWRGTNPFFLRADSMLSPTQPYIPLATGADAE